MLASRLPALFLAVLLLLLPRARAGATIEDIWGVYNGQDNPPTCPKKVTVAQAEGVSANITTSVQDCSRGLVRLREGPRRNEGDKVTDLLVTSGVNLVGTIVLGRGGSVSCPKSARTERIQKNSVFNFIRPRQPIRITLKRSTNFTVGQYYLILRKDCVFLREPRSAGPIPTPPTTSPTDASPGGSAAAQTANSATGSEGGGASIWPWLGPLIGIAVFAVVALAAFFAVRRARSQWYPFSTNQSENSMGEFFDSLPSPLSASADAGQESPRMRYSTDENFHGTPPGPKGGVLLPAPPSNVFDSSSDSDAGGAP